MELVLVRHGEPMRGASDEEAADPGLSPAGHDLARRTASALRQESFAALVTSPMRRARETAAVFEDELGLDPVVADDLAEFDRGMAYLHFEDASAGSPYERYLQGDLSPWGITATAFLEQVSGAFRRIIAENPGGKVLVVSHGGVQNAYLCSVLGLPGLHFHNPSYLSISRVQASRSGITTLVSLNETAHLRSGWCPDPAAHADTPHHC